MTPAADRARDSGARVVVCGRPFRAVLFDLDGVITDTATLHRQAWAAVFDGFLARHHPNQPPFSEQDYLTYVDGKQRADGVRSFLSSRSVTLAEPDVADLAQRKDRLFREILDREGVHTFAPTVDLLHRLRDAGVPVGVVSASRNAAAVLARAGLLDDLDVRVDGMDAARLHLPGKPDPALFLEAARRIRSDPAEVIVVEDAESGVAAARRGGFGLVVRIAPPGRGAGDNADVVVSRLDEVDWTLGVPGQAAPGR